MKALKSLATVAMVAVTIVLTAAVPSEARNAAHSPARGHPAAVQAHRAAERHHDFDRDDHGHGRAFVVGPSFYWGLYAPAYVYSPPPPSYWYYCPSYGAYYPDVPSCPTAWVPVPAS